jgi:hypothetical protein
MACVNPDGSLTPTGRRMLSHVPGEAAEGVSADALAEITGTPLYRARSSLRDLMASGLVSQTFALYRRTDAGDAALAAGPDTAPR